MVVNKGGIKMSRVIGKSVMMSQAMKQHNRLAKGVLKAKERHKSDLSKLPDAPFSGVGVSDTGSPWVFGPGIKTLKLSMVLLVFMYSNDDNKISGSERRSFKKEISAINEFTETDKKELTKVLDELPNTSFVLNYIKNNQLSKAVVMAAIDFVKEDVKLNKKYTKLLNDLIVNYETTVA